MTAQAYPLQWPLGWPRTKAERRDAGWKFKQLSYANNSRERITFPRARDLLYDELRKLGAGNLVVSSNHPTDKYGVPIEGKRRPDDPGVAVYFDLGTKNMTMACDRYEFTAANMRSLGLAVEAMRQLERHGGGHMMERAFSGFAALPAPENMKPRRPWWEVLGLPSDCRDKEMIEMAFRVKSKKAHPDAGGSDEAMHELNDAKREALL